MNIVTKIPADMVGELASSLTGPDVAPQDAPKDAVSRKDLRVMYEAITARSETLVEKDVDEVLAQRSNLRLYDPLLSAAHHQSVEWAWKSRRRPQGGREPAEKRDLCPARCCRGLS